MPEQKYAMSKFTTLFLVNRIHYSEMDSVFRLVLRRDMYIKGKNKTYKLYKLDELSPPNYLMGSL